MAAPVIVDSPTIGINDINLKLRLIRLADMDERSVSFVAKRFLKPAIEEEERRLGLDPIDEDPQYKAVS